MADQGSGATDPNLVAVVKGIVRDAQKLIEQQLVLLRREIEDEIRKARNAAIILVAGAGIVAVACILLMLGALTPSKGRAT